MLKKFLGLLHGHKRTETDAAVNSPLSFVVGGATNSDSEKQIELREPSLEQSGKHMTYIGTGLSSLLKENAGLFGQFVNDPSSVKTDDVINFDVLPTAATEIIADLVGESAEWVKKEMTLRQTTMLFEKYLDLIGWDNIAKSFTLAWQSWNAAVKTATEKKPKRSAKQ